MSWWKKTLKWVGIGLDVAGEVQGGTLGKVLEKSGEKLAGEMKEAEAQQAKDSAPARPPPTSEM